MSTSTRGDDPPADPTAPAPGRRPRVWPVLLVLLVVLGLAGAAAAVLVARGGGAEVAAPELLPTTAEELADAGWRLRWADEFDGTGPPGAPWNVRDEDYSSNEASYLLASNVTQEDGSLRITARREEVGGRDFSSGYVDTVGTFSAGVGTRWEARVRVPTQQGTSAGLWPAFWLRSDQGEGEIDVAEWYGSPHPVLPSADRQVQHTVHASTDGTGPKSGETVSLPAGARPSDGFHLYAVEVEEEGITFSVDGVVTHRVLATDGEWVQSLLDDTWNIRLNLQVGLPGSYASAPDAGTRLPAVMQVDHVRVYER